MIYIILLYIIGYIVSYYAFKWFIKWREEREWKWPNVRRALALSTFSWILLIVVFIGTICVVVEIFFEQEGDPPKWL